MTNIPDLTWCTGISQNKDLLARCPFATVESCPRYYQSLSLAAKTGATGIPAKEDERLLKKWEKSDLWPKTDEYATAVSTADSRLSMLSNFCPEVTFERFGYFSTFLSSYADEIDSNTAHERLRKEGSEPHDPRWNWSQFSAQHYSDCPIYSILHHRSLLENVTAPWWRKHLAEIIVGITVAALTLLLTKLQS